MFGTTQHRWACQEMPMLFTAFPIIGSESQTTLKITFKVLTSIYKWFVLYSFSMFTLYARIKPRFWLHVICLPLLMAAILYIYSPSDDKIYRYLPQALKCIYSISHTATFLLPHPHPHKMKNCCHDLWRDTYIYIYFVLILYHIRPMLRLQTSFWLAHYE